MIFFSVLFVSMSISDSRIYYYVPSSLVMSKEEFISNLNSMEKVVELGRGRGGIASLFKLNDQHIVVKELHTRFPAKSLNTFIKSPDSLPKNISNHINEVRASFELSSNQATSNYVAPFIGLLISNKALSGGGNNFTKSLKLNKTRNKPRSSDDVVYILSKYVYGDTLFNMKTRMNELFTSEFITQLYNDYKIALTALHTSGWMHCDIHENNLYIELNPDNTYKGVRILDFGMSHRIGYTPNISTGHVCRVEKNNNALSEVFNQLRTLFTEILGVSVEENNGNNNNDEIPNRSDKFGIKNVENFLARLRLKNEPKSNTKKRKRNNNIPANLPLPPKTKRARWNLLNKSKNEI